MLNANICIWCSMSDYTFLLSVICYHATNVCYFPYQDAFGHRWMFQWRLSIFMTENSRRWYAIKTSKLYADVETRRDFNAFSTELSILDRHFENYCIVASLVQSFHGIARSKKKVKSSLNLFRHVRSGGTVPHILNTGNRLNGQSFLPDRFLSSVIFGSFTKSFWHILVMFTIRVVSPPNKKTGVRIDSHFSQIVCKGAFIKRTYVNWRRVGRWIGFL